MNIGIDYGRFSKILNGTVDSMNVRTSKYDITVNRLGTSEDLQVFIVEMADNGKEIVDYVSESSLIDFIAENTN